MYYNMLVCLNLSCQARRADDSWQEISCKIRSWQHPVFLMAQFCHTTTPNRSIFFLLHAPVHTRSRDKDSPSKKYLGSP